MTILDIIKEPYHILRILNTFGFLKFLPDELWTKVMWKNDTGKRINLENPTGFNEKMQWLKLYDRRPLYTTLSDKYLAREIVKEKIGEEYLVPFLGAWDSADDIDFDTLPNEFVLKCNHNSGRGMCICRDKSKLDIKKVRKELTKALKENYFFRSREWQYKNIKPRIICEEFIHDGDDTGLIDYKFCCFSGVPKFIYVQSCIFVNGEKTSLLNTILDLDWKPTPYQRNDHQGLGFIPEKPQNLDKMIEIAKVLSDGIPFVRIDLYNVNGKIYFSEYTLRSGGGFGFFSPPEWEEKIGDMLTLPEKYNS